MTNILLTLYIKIFKTKFNLIHLSNTFSKIETLANKISKSQRYAIVFEFYYKSILPPPFVIVSYFFIIIAFFVRFFRIYFIKNVDKKSYRDKKANYISRFFRFVSKKNETGFGLFFFNFYSIHNNKLN